MQRDPGSYEPSELVKWTILIVVMITLGLAVALCAPVRAQEYKDTGTADWFRSLMIPTGKFAGHSCCDQSDCHVVRADYRGNQWWARTREGKEGEELAIPPDRVLTDTVSPFVEDGIGLAVLCEAMSAGPSAQQVIGNMGTPVYVFCFTIPPNFG